VSRRRVRIRRTLRVWRLTVRNGGRYVAHRVRRIGRNDVRRQELDNQFAIRSAEDVARELGNMKGALMKAGQLLSFIIEALPDEAQRALSTLQADAPPMSPVAAAAVVTAELGAPPERVFLDWATSPVAAASVGQVHRAVTRTGEDVAVKVQYPGIGDAIEADLSNAEGLYRLFSAFTLKGLDTKGLVDELRTRMRDELDYRKEAATQNEFHRHFADHPFVTIPAVVNSTSSARVLTSAWVDGLSWPAFLAQAGPKEKSYAGESIWRFVQYAIHRLGVFNGDPHPGNYRFSPHGDVTFLDFGLTKRWAPGEWEVLRPCVDAIIVQRDPDALVVAMESSGFLREGHGLNPEAVYRYVSAPYRPYLTDEFTFSKEFVKQTLSSIIDVKGPDAAVIEQLNMPAGFVVLDRVVWGVNALLAKLEAHNPWRAMLLEYLADGPPATQLGLAEASWRQARSGDAG
jgi:predicted unusual protein kinase regulating ubiquinone biosynthesis (AarF/ABC1/UbiB family)